MVNRIKHILESNPDLRLSMEQSLQRAAKANPHSQTNPVRTLEQWFDYLDYFLHHMPWEGMDIGEDASFFRRIDQNIGYFYFLIDQPLEVLRDKGYIYPSLQYEPRFAQWLKEYNIAWGEWLSSPESWTEEYYQLALSDDRFELAIDRYESPSNWHSWNDFFTRRLRKPYTIHRTPYTFLSPCDGVVAADGLVKTATIANWLDLLGDSPYRSVFENGETTHIVLDVFDYHRFHMPCDGRVLECKTIQGIHAGGGVIIWDEEQGRYRYDQLGVTDFQMLETRGVLIIDTRAYGKIAIVPVGVQQVSSVLWTFDHTPYTIHHTPHMLCQGTELGKFIFGGSDIVLFFEPGRAPHFSADKTVKVGEII